MISLRCAKFLILLFFLSPVFAVAHTCDAVFQNKKSRLLYDVISKAEKHSLARRPNVIRYLEKMQAGLSGRFEDTENTFEILPARNESGISVSGAILKDGSTLKFLIWRMQLAKGPSELEYGSRPQGLNANALEFYVALILYAKKYQQQHPEIQNVELNATDVKSDYVSKVLNDLGFEFVQNLNSRTDLVLKVNL
jgi:hypothetical protein